MELSIINAFKDHTYPFDNYEQILTRICNAYDFQTKLIKNSTVLYKPGNEWLPIYELCMKDIMSALKARDIDLLKEQYANFFRKKFSTGLHGLHFEMDERYFKPERINENDINVYVNLILHNFNLFLNCNPNVDFKKLVRKNIGNPYGYHVDGTFIIAGAEYHYHYANQIKKILQGNNKSVVMELGGGFGGTAYYLLRDFEGITYKCYDLPENAALQAFYLLTAFPEKKFLLSGEPLEDIKYDGMIFSNCEIEDLETDSVDLSFNSYSLAEMEKEAIFNYINIICRTTSKYFNHINHSLFCKFSSDLFPINYNKFELTYRFPVMWSKSQDRNPIVDEHEYLYQTKKIDD